MSLDLVLNLVEVRKSTACPSHRAQSWRLRLPRGSTSAVAQDLCSLPMPSILPPPCCLASRAAGTTSSGA